MYDEVSRINATIYSIVVDFYSESSTSSHRVVKQTSIQVYDLTQAIIQKGELQRTIKTYNDSSDKNPKLLSRLPYNTSTNMITTRQISEQMQPMKQNPNTGQTKRECDTTCDDTDVLMEKHVENYDCLLLSGGRIHERNLAQTERETRLSLNSTKVSENTSNNSLSALRNCAETITYNIPWLGSVSVGQRTIITKQWDSDSRRYEEQRENVQTSVRVQPAPWLINRNYEVKLENLMARYSASSLNIKLEPYNYSPILSVYDVRNPGVKYLEHLLDDHKFSIKDRDIETGQNLLELNMRALEGDRIWSEMENENSSLRYVTTRNIIRTSRWLVSQGLTYDFRGNDPFLNGVGHLSPPDIDQNVVFEVYELESLLLESTVQAPCLPRAKMLLLFAIQNREHSWQLRATIQDLVAEAAVDQDTQTLSQAVRDFWASRNVFDAGIESVVLSSMLEAVKLQQQSKSDTEIATSRLEIMKGPRKVLQQMFVSHNQFMADLDDYTSGVANYVNVCKALALLDDGFGDYMCHVACRHGRLELWLKALRKASYGDKFYRSRHEAICRVSCYTPHVTQTRSTAAMSSTGSAQPHIDEPCSASNPLSAPNQDATHCEDKDSRQLPSKCPSASLTCSGHQELRPQDETRFWDEYEQAAENYTAFVYAEATPEKPLLADSSPGGLVYRLAAGGLSVIASIV